MKIKITNIYRQQHLNPKTQKRDLDRQLLTSKTIMAPDEVSIEAAVSELEGISSLKEEHRMALEAFLDGKDILAL